MEAEESAEGLDVVKARHSMLHCIVNFLLHHWHNVFDIGLFSFVDRHRLPNSIVTNDYNHSTDLWSMLCFFNYNKRCGLSPVNLCFFDHNKRCGLIPVYFFGFYTFETSKIISVITILVLDTEIFTHLILLKPKPVHGIIKSKKDNSSSQALHDTPRVGCTTRACGSYTYPDSPTVVYVNTKGEVEKADTVPRTQARWREEDQLGSSLGVTRPTPLASTQTHVNLEVSLVGIFIVVPVTPFPNQKLWHYLYIVFDCMVSLFTLYKHSLCSCPMTPTVAYPLVLGIFTFYEVISSRINFFKN